VPYRRVATDRAGLNPGAVAAAAAAAAGLARCQGHITDPPHTDAAGRHRPESRRPCGRPLDPALTAAGFRSHPCCDPDEVNPAWPPLPWPEPATIPAPAPARRRRPSKRELAEAFGS
jgi:hypothetical protein